MGCFTTRDFFLSASLNYAATTRRALLFCSPSELFISCSLCPPFLAMETFPNTLSSHVHRKENFSAMEQGNLNHKTLSSSGGASLCNSQITHYRQGLPFTRAETEYGRSRASSSMPEAQRTTDSSRFRGEDESGNVNVWDSNAEGYRRNWRRSGSSSFRTEPPEERNGAYVTDSERDWQWWRSGPDEDDYEGDTDIEEDDDSMSSFLDLEGFDMLSAFSLLRWIVPAAAVLLPLLFGGPMFLMGAFALFPLAQKLLGLLWTGARKQERYRSARQRGGRWSRRTWSPDTDDSRDIPFWAPTSYNQREGKTGEDWEKNFISSSTKQDEASKLGGWDEHEEEPLMLRNSKRATSPRAGLIRRGKRKEVPLFFRLLVALFPFLRSWGGFL